MLKKLLIGLAATLGLLVLVAYLLPRHVQVERSVHIERPASQIFPLLNGFKRFNEWSPWFPKDPDARYTRSGPDFGVGAQHEWEGDPDQVGKGRTTVMDSKPDQRVDIELEFDGMDPAAYAFVLTEANGGTEVTWSMRADMGHNPIGRYMGLMMDGWIGTDYETGLAKLKQLVESFPNADISGLEVELVERPAQTSLLIEKSTSSDPAAIGQAYGEAYAVMTTYLSRQRANMVAPPFGIEHAEDAETYRFSAGLSIDRADLQPESPITVVAAPAQTALRLNHVGAYDQLGDSVAKLRGYAAVYQHEITGDVIYVWIDDPTQIAPEALRTEVFLPVKAATPQP